MLSSRTEQGLPVLKQGGIDLVDIMDAMRHKECDDQVKFTAG